MTAGIKSQQHHVPVRSAVKAGTWENQHNLRARALNPAYAVF